MEDTTGGDGDFKLEAVNGVLAETGFNGDTADRWAGVVFPSMGMSGVLMVGVVTVVDLAAGVGVNSCELLKFKDWAELLNDEGGDGVAGDELRPDSFPLNWDLIWLKFRLVVTLFFDTDTWIRPGANVIKLLSFVFDQDTPEK